MEDAPARLAFDQKHHAVILPIGDQDFFTFEVTETGYVLPRFDLDEGPQNLELRTECFRGKKSLGEAVCWRLDPGSCTIRLYDRYDDESSELAFPFWLEFLKGKRST